LIGTYSSIAIAAPILLIGAKQPQTGQRPAKVTGAGIVSGAGAVQKV
jgi:preprotein translocase subunit SecF